MNDNTEKESTQSIAGTLRWMAPELFARKTSSPSTASDIPVSPDSGLKKAAPVQEDNVTPSYSHY